MNDARVAGGMELTEVTWFVDDIDALTFDSPAPVKAGPDGIYEPPLPGVTKEI